jgi:hypothetical protein
MTLTNFINFDGIKYTLTSVKPTNRSGNVYHLSNENHPIPFSILSRLSRNGLTIAIALKRELDDFHLTNGTRYHYDLWV